jgi:pimeloyl-ACP methyl ester carboxylesterase
VIQTIQYQNGQALSYVDAGEPGGFPILIQHGMIASIRTPGLFDRLAACGARPISIARPGYGESSPYEMRNIGEWGEVVAALVDELGFERFDVFGISSGAPYSYAIGRRFPDRTRNLFILNGTPALYDDDVLALWPYPSNRGASLAELQALAYELFFAHLSPADLERDDIRDSLANNCFGIAQDLKLRVLDWGFRLVEVQPRVYMRHNRADGAVSLKAAQMTAALLRDCRLEIRDEEEHFSQAVLDDFIREVMAEHYENWQRR